MTHTYNGITDTINGHAKRWKMSPTTIVGRLGRGWSIEDAIETPAVSTYSSSQRGVPSKNDAEMWLNDRTIDEISESMLPAFNPAKRAKKPGQWLRRYNPMAFNKWYDEEFKINFPK